MITLINKILYDTVYNSAPIILCVLGGLFAHKANVLNIALEGMMIIGAFSSVLFAILTKNIFLAVMLGILSTLVIGIIFSYMSVSLDGNVIIIGLAINLFASALVSFILKVMNTAVLNANNIIDVASLKINIAFIKDLPFLGSVISGHTFITYLAFLFVFIIWVLMYKTKFGIYVRVVGESDEAARSVGININLIKYIAILMGAFSCALAASNMALERMALFTNGMISGRGFIAIAAIFCGSGRPVTSSAYAVIFGFAMSLSINLSMYVGSASGLFNMFPYVMIVFILSMVSVIKLRNNYLRGFKNE